MAKELLFHSRREMPRAFESARKALFIFAMTLMLFVKSSHAADAPIVPMRVDKQYCEYCINPLSIDTAAPRFTWILTSDERAKHQSAYRVIVATSLDQLKSGNGDKWDSGKVNSDKSVNIEYQGKNLESTERCYWQVHVWDERGQETLSDVATFEMGLLKPADWGGKWIGAPDSPANAMTPEKAIKEYNDVSNVPAPLLRKTFQINGGVRSARLYYSGLGWSEVNINGSRINDRVLDPATTDYNKRILYVSEDITRRLKTGTNSIGVILGNGWYCPAYGSSPRLIAQLNITFDDGTVFKITSDESWKTSESWIKQNSLTKGEVCDSREENPHWCEPEFDDRQWQDVKIKDSPGGRLVPQLLSSIKMHETWKAHSITNPAPKTYVCDFGKFFAGWVRCSLKGNNGDRINIKYAPTLRPNGLVQELPEGRAQDSFICRGLPTKEIYEPRFTFHPVRYVQIENCATAPTIDDVEARAAYNDVDYSAEFECSNVLLNQIHACVRQTIKNELFGIQMDCINAEHWGWLEPGSNPGTLYPRPFMPQFWIKFLDDVRAAQLSDGVIPDVVPCYPIKQRKTGDPAWAGNYPILVWYLYQYYDDQRILQDNYESIKKWIASLTALSKEHLISYGYYGDHMLPGLTPETEQWMSKETRQPLLKTAFYYKNVETASKIAAVLQQTKDAEFYTGLSREIKAAYNKKWFGPGEQASESQTESLVSLSFGLTDERQARMNNVLQCLKQYNGHHHTGNIGTTALMETLASAGHGQLMYDLVNRKDYPGWGYMVDHGASTLWESWSGKFTNDDRCSMAMFTTIDQFFFADLAGIQGPHYFSGDPVAPGFAKVVIKPIVPAGLTFAKASHPTVRGKISSSWRIADGTFTLSVGIPTNSTGQIFVPKLSKGTIKVSESGKQLWDNGQFNASSTDVLSGRDSNEYIVFEVQSGQYSFSTSIENETEPERKK